MPILIFCQFANFGNQSLCSFFVFGNLVCVIFFMTVSVCKARQARLLKNVNKHFRNFDGQKQQNPKNENEMKSSIVSKDLVKKAVLPVVTALHLQRS